MLNLSNHGQMLIAGSNISSTHTSGTATPSLLSVGEVVLTTVDGVIVTGATTGDVVLVQGQGATKPLIKSSPFNFGQLLTAKRKAYSAAVQQVSYIGYNGTSGNIVLPTYNAATPVSIIVRNSFKSNYYQYSDKLMKSVVGRTLTSLDTILTMADNLAKDAIIDVQKYVNIPYAVERLASTSATLLTGTGFINIAVTNSSSLVTYSQAHGRAIGDYIKIGQVYYKVSTVPTSTTLTLDSPYQGVSATVVNGGTITTPTVSVTNASTAVTTSANHGITSGNKVVIVIAGVTLTGTAGATTSITLDSAYAGTTNGTASIAASGVFTFNTGTDSVGIRFTGIPQKKYGVNTFRYEVSKFNTTTNINDFAPGTNVQNAAVVASEGSGTYEQVADAEYFYQLAEGMNDQALIQVPPVTMRSNVSSTGKYDLITFEFVTKSGNTDILHNPSARKQVVLAVDSTSTSQSSNLITTINTVLGLTSSTTPSQLV